VINHDQPTIFGDRIIAAVSSAHNGPMNFRNNDPAEITANRLAFFDEVGIDPLQVTLLQVTYEDTTDFTRYKVAEDDQAGEGALEPYSDTEADALVVTRPEQAIFLPLADCTGAIIYDPVNRILMVSHLGRHSTEQEGGSKSIAYLVKEFDSDPGDLLVWLSPAVGKESYPLHALEGKGLHEAIIEQMVAAGVQEDNIEVSPVDTAESDEYFSHSAFKAGDQSEDGRFAIVAMMVE
jgi:copper oxidase (laccase) domain-containing protein